MSPADVKYLELLVDRYGLPCLVKALANYAEHQGQGAEKRRQDIGEEESVK